jgi:hypothetical protein
MCTLGVLRWQGLCCFSRKRRAVPITELTARASLNRLGNTTAFPSMNAPVTLFQDPSALQGGGVGSPEPAPLPLPTPAQPDPRPPGPILEAAAAMLMNLPRPVVYVSSIVFARGHQATGP